LVAGVLLAGCVAGEGKPAAGRGETGLKTLSVEELRQGLENKDFFLVDVHVPEQEHFPQTDAFIPYDAIESNLGSLPKDKNAKIVLYCRTDRMSGIAGEKLVRLGYTNVYHVVGGKVAWDGMASD